VWFLKEIGKPEAFFEKGKLFVKNKFWEVIHDPEKGGCITGIRFFNGSNRNILLKPISSYFGSFWDTLNDKATINLVEQSNCLVVQVNGELKDVNEFTTSGIKYSYSYEYREGHIKITKEYSLEKGIAGISEVGIGCMDIVPELNNFAARSSHVNADKILASCAAVWGTINFDDKVSFEEKYIPLYMAVFRKGVEGIEFLPGYDLEEWTKQLLDSKDQGEFQIRGKSNPKCVQIIIEPFNAIVTGSSGIRLSGQYTFSYYLGLPMIPEKVPQKYMHMSFNNHPWPSDEDIRKWAYSGVNVVRLHNDYHPSGDFWHDGSWPPYDEKGMAELKRVINTCHRYGIKIVPYFSLFEINPKSDGFANGYVLWRRTVDDKGSLIETYPPNWYFGFGMCLSSGWKDFLKRYVKKVVKTLGFDGVYYDYAQYWPCNNKLHSKGWHSIIGDIIEFLEYTRSLIGEDGIMLLHQSGWAPCVLIENYADGHIMFEDCVHWKEIPPLEEFPPNTLHLTFMNVAPKIPCLIVGVSDRVKGAWDLCAKCSVIGAFPHGGLGPEAEPVLTLFEVFRAFDLSKFKFKNHTMRYIKTDKDAVKGAIYFNQDRVLVVLSNVRDEPTGFKWTVDLKRLGWNPSQKYHVIGSLGEPIEILGGKVLISNGVKDYLEGLRFKIYSIVRYRKAEKYVLYNTRSWIEKCADGVLTVETKGPTGQKATLKFRSPERPKEVRINSNLLREKDWCWDGITKIGIVKYMYVDTLKTVTTIQIL